MRRLRDASHIRRLLRVETRSCPRIRPLRGRHPSHLLPSRSAILVSPPPPGTASQPRMRRPWCGPEGRDCPKPRGSPRCKPIGDRMCPGRTHYDTARCVASGTLLIFVAFSGLKPGAAHKSAPSGDGIPSPSLPPSRLLPVSASPSHASGGGTMPVCAVHGAARRDVIVRNPGVHPGASLSVTGCVPAGHIMTLHDASPPGRFSYSSPSPG